MTCFAITYDLDSPGQNYQELYKRIKSYQWCHPVESTWFIVTTQSAKEVREYLLPAIDKNDKLYIGGLTRQAAWYGLSKESSDWLKMHL